MGETAAARLPVVGIGPRWLFPGVMLLFGCAVLIQIFLAGGAALIAPDEWQMHVAWVHLFQWISIVLPICAYLARRRIGFTLLNCVPMAIIGLQYSLIHLAINHAEAGFAGLHAVGGTLLFGFVVYVLQDWKHTERAASSGALTAAKAL